MCSFCRPGAGVPLCPAGWCRGRWGGRQESILTPQSSIPAGKTNLNKSMVAVAGGHPAHSGPWRGTDRGCPSLLGKPEHKPAVPTPSPAQASRPQGFQGLWTPGLACGGPTCPQRRGTGVKPLAGVLGSVGLCPAGAGPGGEQLRPLWATGACRPTLRLGGMGDVCGPRGGVLEDSPRMDSWPAWLLGALSRDGVGSHRGRQRGQWPERSDTF